LSYTDGSLPFTLSRKQFLVRLCFAMTINKSQGQSFETEGIDLRAPVFTYGQFYVAVSRTSSVVGLQVLLANLETRETANVIYLEVLSDISY
jgi:ATP-dependent DNA helicase PIF1